MSLIKKLINWLIEDEDKKPLIKTTKKQQKSPIKSSNKSETINSFSNNINYRSKKDNIITEKYDETINSSENKFLIKEVIKGDKNLVELNKQRSRNFLLVKGLVDLEYDITTGKIKFKPNMKYSIFDHDTNRIDLEI